MSSHKTPESPGEPHAMGRRTFCVLGYTAAALIALPLEAEPIIEGQASDLRRMTSDTRASLGVKAIRDYRKQGGFFLIADASGIYAVSAICTHAGCSVRLEEGKSFGCPCHDSEFDLQGGVLQGPAKLPLKHFEVTESSAGGPLAVDLSKPVSPHVRL